MHREAVTQEHTAESYDSWRDDHLTQVAVAWILDCVFVRFLEDNGLVDPFEAGHLEGTTSDAPACGRSPTAAR